MITERSKDFVKAEKDSSDPDHPKIKYVIDNERVNKVVLSEINEFKQFRDELEKEGKQHELIFDKIIKKCKENEIMFEAKSRQIKEELDKKKVTANMKEDGEKQAEKTKFSSYMNYIAGTTLVVIGMLMILSIGCVEWTLCSVESNPYLQILESNFLMVLVGTVVGPMVSKYLKEKYDIQIKSEQLVMITQDAVKTVSMYNKVANELRDDKGQLSDEQIEKLQNAALSSIKNNFGTDKYKELITSLSGQAFKKAIEYAVAQKKIESFPLEQEQVEKIVRQSLDAVPYVIDWQNKKPEVKETFIRGYVKNLLQNTGADGWAYNALEGVFDAEVNKRLTAAAVADARGLIKTNETEPMKKYSSVIVDAVLESGVK
ncbi:hypothetical protein NKOR_02340 [Candidatus Nitrosopumilus koreensis AR1]|uniref:Uncharacterized protein n=1 Tax=Candidatus Nitrosopumilus koreensis AR1 TaxID=1229908 RepID=K0B7D6_9ARCH|nr:MULTISPECIES: hypothetical protein [Nitrosopumilus]AFS80366.1 hypothetical protein NKOR_02340 [Candidatus Nitrosopumilus koreensis AR1]